MRDKRGDLLGGAKPGRSQSPHSTEAVSTVRGPASKTGLREGRAGRWMREIESKAMTAPRVSKQTKQGTEAQEIAGVEALIWTERMVSALVNGVEGGK